MIIIVRDIHFPGNDSLKHDKAIKACLIKLNIILYYCFSLDVH